jgi:hypothetical protein
MHPLANIKDRFRMRILIVEDDIKISAYVKKSLAEVGR